MSSRPRIAAGRVSVGSEGSGILARCRTVEQPDPASRGPRALAGDDVADGRRAPGRRRSLTDKAYDHVRGAILHGELPVGNGAGRGDDRRRARDLEDAGAAGAPAAAHEGLLEVGPRRQLVVRGFSVEHRNEILRIREALEEIAVETACRAMSLEDIDLLRLTLLRQQRAADAHDEEAFLELDEEFHIRIAMGANLPIVARLLEQMRGFARLMRLGRHQPPEHLQESSAEHARIVDALESRDVDEALAALHGAPAPLGLPPRAAGRR